MTAEFDLYKRSIVYVVNYFDEERELPWNYVRRTGDGRFEAIATHLFDGIRDPADNEARERSLGMYDTLADARAVLCGYLKRVAAADQRDRDRLDLSWTIQ